MARMIAEAYINDIEAERASRCKTTRKWSDHDLLRDERRDAA